MVGKGIRNDEEVERLQVLPVVAFVGPVRPVPQMVTIIRPSPRLRLSSCEFEQAARARYRNETYRFVPTQS